MFAKMIDNPQKVDNLKKPQKGKVAYNLDPLKLGRIKCWVRGIYEDADHNNLPWAFPKNPTGLGGKPDCSSFCVPEIDSEVTIVFPFGDENTPFYDGYWQSKLTTQSSIFTADYPEMYGWVDSVIEWLRINKKDLSIEFFRSTLGDMIRIDKDGNLSINVPASLMLNVGKDVTFQVGGKYVVNSAGNLTLATDSAFGFQSSGNFGMMAGGEISGDAPAIHWNSGHTQAPAADKALCSDNAQAILAKIQSLQEEVTALKALVATNKDKIAK